MTLKVSISGIDGCGKTTSINDVVNYYAAEMVVAKLGKPVYVQDGKDRIYIAKEVGDFSDKAHSQFDDWNFRLGVGIANMAYGTTHKMIQNHVIKKYEPSLIIFGRDPVLDSAVYSTYYFPLSKHIGTELRLKLTRLATGEDYPRDLLFMDVPIDVALARIERRIEEEKQKASSDLKRKKWRHMHENKKDMAELQKYFYECISILTRFGVDARIVDATAKKDEVVKELIRNIDDVFGKKGADRLR